MPLLPLRKPSIASRFHLLIKPLLCRLHFVLHLPSSCMPPRTCV
jgi:hypothetical protein